MAELKNSGSRSHDIDVDDESRRSSSAAACAVCMEAVEWAAYGPCAHPDAVCAECAVRIRASGGSRQCCICNTPSPTVLIAKAGASPARGAPWEAPPAAGEGRAGEYWYHERAAAYFDDEEQYRKAVRLVRLRPPLVMPPAISTSDVEPVGGGGASSWSEEEYHDACFCCCRVRLQGSEFML